MSWCPDVHGVLPAGEAYKLSLLFFLAKCQCFCLGLACTSWGQLAGLVGGAAHLGQCWPRDSNWDWDLDLHVQSFGAIGHVALIDWLTRCPLFAPPGVGLICMTASVRFSISFNSRFFVHLFLRLYFYNPICSFHRAVILKGYKINHKPHQLHFFTCPSLSFYCEYWVGTAVGKELQHTCIIFPRICMYVWGTRRSWPTFLATMQIYIKTEGK